MTILSTLITSIIEGITEFLPISSTFHLLMTQRLLGIAETEFVKLFSVFIQAGAILAVVLLYAKDLWHDKWLVIKASVAFAPTALVGLLLYDVIKNVFFESQAGIIYVFILVGLLFILLEKFLSKQKDPLNKVIADIGYRDALIIGGAQALAVVPGVSRAGAVIVAMILLRYRRPDAARFSFILSIPTIFAASALDLFEMRAVAFASFSNVGLLLLGFLGAFISALFIVKWFISYLQGHSLEIFGWYRIGIGLILLFLLGK
ncbi:MAG: undecaprenyl-diphosphatase [Candidatus Pacebacteria bacterium CG10_big_fil_rev_8_21_14_0_10_44_11]|nr:MAG: undecaprenyl-diphosphatase [Candidatus Pacebacteria bacterium CG10_big_fil_rev_8_21_14_0_10_44_11]